MTAAQKRKAKDKADYGPRLMAATNDMCIAYFQDGQSGGDGRSEVIARAIKRFRAELAAYRRTLKADK